MFDVTSIETMQKMIDEGTSGPGPVRAAQTLIKHADVLDTPARRARVLAIAHTGMNLGLWGRYSDAVHYASLDLVRMITGGREHDEHYTEKTAREYREQENERQRLHVEILAMSSK